MEHEEKENTMVSTDPAVWGLKIEMAAVMNELKNLNKNLAEMKVFQETLAEEMRSRSGAPCVFHTQTQLAIESLQKQAANCTLELEQIRGENKIQTLKISMVVGGAVIIITAITTSIMNHFLT